MKKFFSLLAMAFVALAMNAGNIVADGPAEEVKAPAAETFEIVTVTNSMNEPGVVQRVFYQFNVVLPEGYEIDASVVPTLNDMTGTILAIDDITAAVRFTSAGVYAFDEAGDYVLTIPAGSFIVNGVTSAAYSATWTIPSSELGIRGVAAERVAKAYDLNGRHNATSHGMVIRDGRVTFIQ